VDQVKRAVVQVVSTEGIGTGVIFDAQGLLLTNHHVVEDDAAPLIELHDGRKTTGLVLGVDEITDVAVIRISAREVLPATLGDSSQLKQGQEVVALGFPLAGEVTITGGMVSATERQLFTVGPRKEIRYVQTDAAINPGNSGGPLITRQGEVVGINTLKLAGVLIENLGFAIPVNRVKDRLPELLAGGDILFRPKPAIVFTYIPPTFESYSLVTMDEEGLNQVKLSSPGVVDYMGRWSPDGSKIVFESSTAYGSDDIYVMDWDGSNRIRLTDSPANDREASSPHR